jgi:hypothetical protein
LVSRCRSSDAVSERNVNVASDIYDCAERDRDSARYVYRYTERDSDESRNCCA